MRTIWDVLTSVNRDVQVTFPVRPSHAIIELPTDWLISVTVEPSSASTLGRQFMSRLEPPIRDPDVKGRRGSPEGWFDLAQNAEVAILRPNGTWYHCQGHPLVTNPAQAQFWRFVTVMALEQLIARVLEQPSGCLCPECNPR